MLLLLYLIVSTEASLTDDYSWRDYNGKIPSDAFPGGLDRNGNPMHIGQVLYENKIIPGKILHNKANIYIEWSGKEVVLSRNIKILCTEQLQKFEWVLTDRKNLLSLQDERQLLKGGYEEGYNTYVGRVMRDAETIVGKIVCNKTKCLGLFTTKDGKMVEHESFRVLAYNPDVPTVDKCSDPIDVRFQVF